MGQGPGAVYARLRRRRGSGWRSRCPETPITGLLRIGWASVAKIVERVVSERLDEGRLDGLVMLGVDEISYQADHRFLTCVADHRTGGIV